MFTGLIQSRSEVLRTVPGENGYNLVLGRPLQFLSLEIGESIAVDGVCLTLTEFDATSMTFFVGGETISKSTLKSAPRGRTLNLERSLRVGDRVGGHFVTGHVDGTARITASATNGDCLELSMALSSEQFKWTVPKGSISINGVSLTVNSVYRDSHSIEVLLIPETLERTNLAHLNAGDEVNVECDQTVKIIAHQMSFYGGRHEQHP